MLLKTALNEAHRKLGARMVDFGGWEKGAWMPDQKAWSLNRVQEKRGVYPRPYNGKWEIAAYRWQNRRIF